MPRDDSQKDSRAAFGSSPPLLPVSQGAGADPQERRELRLAEPILPPHRSDIRLGDGKRARRLAAAPQDLSPFANALPKLFEKILPHWYSVSTICRKTLFCAGVRSALSLLANANSMRSLLEAGCQ